MIKNLKHLREVCWILGCSLLVLTGAYCLKKTVPFLSTVLMEVTSLFWGIAVVILLYDQLQERQKRRVWLPLEKIVLQGLSAQLSHLIWDFHWRLSEQGWQAYGTMVEEWSSEPSQKHLDRLRQYVGDIKTNVGRFEGNFHHEPFQIRDGEAMDGDKLVEEVKKVLTDAALDSLRNVVAPLSPMGDESVAIMLAAHRLINHAWLTSHTGAGARMGELGGERFLELLVTHLDMIIEAYQAVLTQWETPKSRPPAVEGREGYG